MAPLFEKQRDHRPSSVSECQLLAKTHMMITTTNNMDQMYVLATPHFVLEFPPPSPTSFVVFIPLLKGAITEDSENDLEFDPFAERVEENVLFLDDSTDDEHFHDRLHSLYHNQEPTITTDATTTATARSDEATTSLLPQTHLQEEGSDTDDDEIKGIIAC